MLTYDLSAPNQRYEDVKETIKSFNGAYIKLQNSFWLLRNELTPNEMTDKLRIVMDKNDKLFICEINDNYQGLASKDNWKFIKENIFNR